MSEPLRILLLGPPQILAGDQPLTLSRRGLRSLLYYLACQETRQTRGQLGLLFWEDQPEAGMRKSLREMLSRLRAELPAGEILRVEQEFVWLDAERASCDVKDFLRLHEQATRLMARIPGNSPFPEGLHDLIERALNLWRGPRFQVSAELKGAGELEAWAEQMDERLARARRTLLEQAASHAALVGQVDQSAAYLRAALEINPLDDRLLARLLRALERGGRISEAAELCRRSREEYALHGLAIPAELEAFWERQQRPEERFTGGQGGVEPRRSLHLPLVGREKELEILRLAFFQRTPLVILGEAGAGKSRLLQEFAAATAPDARILIAAASQPGGETPFQPVIDLLRAGASAEEWRKIPTSWVSILSLLLPELAALVPGLALPATQSGITQAVVFEAVHQVLRIVSAHQRLVLLVDNAQWCDESTFDTFHYLFDARLFESGVFLAAAAREDENLPPLSRFLRRFSGQNNAVSLRLAPLNEAHIRQITRLVFDSQASDTLAKRLRRDTGGNPFHLLETLRMLLEYTPDALAAVENGRIPLAGSVRELVRERLQRLSPQAQSALGLAAVAGSEFSLDLLEPAGRYASDELVDWIEELERAQLVHAAGKEWSSGGALNPAAPGLVRYQFACEQVREIALLELSPARRRLFHLRVAEALQAQGAAQPGALAAVLAGHYQQAGEERQAVQFWLQAAGYARRLYSLTEQKNAYQQVEMLFEQAPNAISGPELLALYSGWIELGFMQADAGVTRRAADTLMRLGWRREDQKLIRTGMLGLATAATLEENGEEALRALDLVRPFLESGGEFAHWLSYHFTRGSALVMLGRVDETIQELESAIELAVQAGDTVEAVELRANCGYLLAGAYLFSGWPEKALAAAEKSLADSRAVMSHASAARAIAMRGLVHYHLGDYPAANEYNKMALRMAMPMCNSHLIAQIYANMAQLSLAQGKLDESWGQTIQAIEAGKQNNFKRAIAQAYNTQGDIFRVLYNDSASTVCYREALIIDGASPNGMDAICRQGLSLVWTGCQSEGMELIERCLTHCREQGMGLQSLFAMGAKSLALCRMERLEEAYALAEELAVEAARRSAPQLRGLAFMPLGLRALSEGRLDDARQKALALAEHGHKIGNVEIELSGCLLALRAGNAPPAIAARVKELADWLEQNTQTPELRPHAERMLTGVRSLIS